MRPSYCGMQFVDLAGSSIYSVEYLFYIVPLICFVQCLFYIIPLMADGPQRATLPSCLWSLMIFSFLAGFSRCKFSTLVTRQPMVDFYLYTLSRFLLKVKLRRKIYK